MKRKLFFEWGLWWNLLPERNLQPFYLSLRRSNCPYQLSINSHLSVMRLQSSFPQITTFYIYYLTKKDLSLHFILFSQKSSKTDFLTFLHLRNFPYLKNLSSKFPKKSNTLQPPLTVSYLCYRQKVLHSTTSSTIRWSQHDKNAKGNHNNDIKKKLVASEEERLRVEMTTKQKKTKQKKNFIADWFELWSPHRIVFRRPQRTLSSNLISSAYNGLCYKLESSLLDCFFFLWYLFRVFLFFGRFFTRAWTRHR